VFDTNITLIGVITYNYFYFRKLSCVWPPPATDHQSTPMAATDRGGANNETTEVVGLDYGLNHNTWKVYTRKRKKDDVATRGA